MPTPAKTTHRGYGHNHQQLREQWRPHVEAGKVTCPRCRKPILPGTPWDLGHDDHDRSVYTGPEHRACNRRAGAHKGNARRIRRTRTRERTSRNW